MTSGTNLRLATVALTLATATLHAAEVGTDTLLARLVRPPPETTTFVEVRYSRLLTTPIVVTGWLEHRQDGALVRCVESPYRETSELLGENVLVDREGSKPRRFSLSRAPELRGMLAGFGALLKGDRKMLDQYFQITTRGRDERWQLELSPRDDRLRRRLSAILVDGGGDRPRCLTVQEPDDDASVMALGVRGVADLPESLEKSSLQAWCTGDAGR